LDYPWVAPPPGSPLLADLRSMLLSFGATELRIRYTGGSLLSVVNFLKGSDALTVLPHGVVFAQRNEKVDHRAAGQRAAPRARPWPPEARRRAPHAGGRSLRPACAELGSTR
jgi:hypothetical protein